MTTRKSADQAPVRPARRLPGRTWRDPRLLVALVLVLGATVGGARLVASQDDTVAYWALSDDVRAAGPVSADQLEPVRARLDDDSARRYLTADEPPALEGRVWARDVPAGSLLDATALTTAATSEGHELPLKVEEGSYPADLSAGDRVDVWAGPAPGQGVTEPADRVLSDARVVSAGRADPSLGQTARTVVVAVASDALQSQVVAAVSARHVTLVRVR
ncbi:flagellar biosynthesis protein FlgA [Aeromicrobium sp. IC_218]|uniref:flagellar biosynthesis protein FlgA n=1 Tax=Aeromicrobium sp. IC_218 TaxID=2545468 RepID=UPI0010392A94|nr:flagellar biosynthesis protein FlgA [Aeromicrobium sp. IC_218]TCI95680.1 flagellar biosynthesis protein FlgA [Aeromicrobium sp. IC_218]